MSNCPCKRSEAVAATPQSRLAEIALALREPQDMATALAMIVYMSRLFSKEDREF